MLLLFALVSAAQMELMIKMQLKLHEPYGKPRICTEMLAIGQFIYHVNTFNYSFTFSFVELIPYLFDLIGTTVG